ncbi:MAG TPA: DUF3307 domain-containing protein [Woeseiaceae bacterium]|nr:DUF3307 domain-containing protein [Woeseiaceae bacterium]
MTLQATVLLASLLLAHFLGDFTPLASQSMQRAKAIGAPVGPIALHALVHAALVAIVVAAVVSPGVRLVALAGAIEFLSHLGLDWGRGRLGRSITALFDPSRQIFWTAFGLDQAAHAIVLVGIALLVTG